MRDSLIRNDSQAVEELLAEKVTRSGTDASVSVEYSGPASLLPLDEEIGAVAETMAPRSVSDVISAHDGSGLFYLIRSKNTIDVPEGRWASVEDIPDAIMAIVAEEVGDGSEELNDRAWEAFLDDLRDNLEIEISDIPDDLGYASR